MRMVRRGGGIPTKRHRGTDRSGTASSPLSLLLPRYRIKNPPVTLIVISSRFSLPSQSHAKPTVGNDTENGPCMHNLSCPSVSSSPSPLCSHQLPVRIRLANRLAFLAFSWWQGPPGSGDTIAIPEVMMHPYYAGFPRGPTACLSVSPTPLGHLSWDLARPCFTSSFTPAARLATTQ